MLENFGYSGNYPARSDDTVLTTACGNYLKIVSEMQSNMDNQPIENFPPGEEWRIE